MEPVCSLPNGACSRKNKNLHRRDLVAIAQACGIPGHPYDKRPYHYNMLSLCSRIRRITGAPPQVPGATAQEIAESNAETASVLADGVSPEEFSAMKEQIAESAAVGRLANYEAAGQIDQPMDSSLLAAARSLRLGLQSGLSLKEAVKATSLTPQSVSPVAPPVAVVAARFSAPSLASRDDGDLWSSSADRIPPPPPRYSRSSFGSSADRIPPPPPRYSRSSSSAAPPPVPPYDEDDARNFLQEEEERQRVMSNLPALRPNLLEQIKARKQLRRAPAREVQPAVSNLQNMLQKRRLQVASDGSASQDSDDEESDGRQPDAVLNRRAQAQQAPQGLADPVQMLQNALDRMDRIRPPVESERPASNSADDSAEWRGGGRSRRSGRSRRRSSRKRRSSRRRSSRKRRSSRRHR